jgi:hypothetical protein
VVKEIGKELVLYDSQNHKVHHLNQTAALVWKHGDGKTFQELAGILQRELQAPVDEKLVALAWSRLENAGLVSPKGPRIPQTPALSRRQLLKHISLAGCVGLVLPAVTTLVAGSPVLAGTPRPARPGQAPSPHLLRGDYRCCEYDCVNPRGQMRRVRYCKDVPVGGNCPANSQYSNCQCFNGANAGAPPCDPPTCNTIGTFCD